MQRWNWGQDEELPGQFFAFAFADKEVELHRAFGLALGRYYQVKSVLKRRYLRVAAIDCQALGCGDRFNVQVRPLSALPCVEEEVRGGGGGVSCR